MNEAVNRDLSYVFEPDTDIASDKFVLTSI